MKPKVKQMLRKAFFTLFGNVFYQPSFRDQSNSPLTVLRTQIQGWRLRALLRCGFGVVLIGRAASGKTVFLNQSLPGKVISPDLSAQLQDGKPKFDTSALPDGLVAIDEPKGWGRSSIVQALSLLSNRQMVVAIQHFEQSAELGLDKAFAGRLVVLFMGAPSRFKLEAKQASIMNSVNFEAQPKVGA
jgi:hypothetical protein